MPVIPYLDILDINGDYNNKIHLRLLDLDVNGILANMGVILLYLDGATKYSLIYSIRCIH